jgi:DNA sulfur modification protein DndE
MKKPLKLPSRVRLSKEVSGQLSYLKAKTQLTPNILARIALATSIESGFDYRQLSPSGDGLEFNLPTLLGDQTLIYELLLLSETGAEDQDELTHALVSHIENGVASLRQAKALRDVGSAIG